MKHYPAIKKKYRLVVSLVAHAVKNLPAMWETQVQSLGQEDSSDKGMATHFIILAWKIPWTEEPGRPQLWGHKELDTTEWLTLFTFRHGIGHR